MKQVLQDLHNCATVVQVLQNFFYFYCMFYCMFYFTCDRSLTNRFVVDVPNN